MATTGTADTSSSEHGTEQSQASGIGQTLRDATCQKVTDQKTRASDTLGSVASAVRSMTEPLRADGHSGVADYVDQAAGGINRWADELRQRDLNDTIRVVHDFARREPAVFLGLAFGAGALLARFLKSSTGDKHSSSPSGSEGLWGRQAPVRRDSMRGNFAGGAQASTAGLSATTFGTAQTNRTSHESPLVSSEMPSAREVL
jgi:hypothetical protein